MRQKTTFLTAMQNQMFEGSDALSLQPFLVKFCKKSRFFEVDKRDLVDCLHGCLGTVPQLVLDKADSVSFSQAIMTLQQHYQLITSQINQLMHQFASVQQGTNSVKVHFEKLYQYHMNYSQYITEQQVSFQFVNSVQDQLRQELNRVLMLLPPDRPLRATQLLNHALQWEAEFKLRGNTYNSVTKRTDISAQVQKITVAAPEITSAPSGPSLLPRQKYTHQRWKCKTCSTNTHSFMVCPVKCHNCHGSGHTTSACPTPCPNCHLFGHYYASCRSTAVAPVLKAPATTALPITLSTLPKQLPQVAVREVKIATRPATLGFDSCSCVNVISTHFLEQAQIHVTPDQTGRQILNGLSTTTHTLGTVTLPVKFLTGLDHITFQVVSSLPAPLDALVGWNWMETRDVRLCPSQKAINMFGIFDTISPLSIFSVQPLNGPHSSMTGEAACQTDFPPPRQC